MYRFNHSRSYPSLLSFSFCCDVRYYHKRKNESVNSINQVFCRSHPPSLPCRLFDVVCGDLPFLVHTSFLYTLSVPVRSFLVWYGSPIEDGDQLLWLKLSFVYYSLTKKKDNVRWGSQLRDSFP